MNSAQCVALTFAKFVNARYAGCFHRELFSALTQAAIHLDQLLHLSAFFLSAVYHQNPQFISP